MLDNQNPSPVPAGYPSTRYTVNFIDKNGRLRRRRGRTRLRQTSRLDDIVALSRERPPGVAQDHGNVGAKNLVLEVMIKNPKINNYKTTKMALSGSLGTGNTMMWMAAPRFAAWTALNVGVDVVQQTYQGQSEKCVP